MLHIDPPLLLITLVIFLGLIFGASFGPLNVQPIRYAKVSLSIVIANTMTMNTTEKY